MNFVFYSIETTGPVLPFDQILQIAAIRTDAAFNELDRLILRSQLMPHVAPSPSAMLSLGIPAHRLFDRRLARYEEMMALVDRAFRSWTPAIFVAFGASLHERLAQGLFQTLHDPLLTTKHGNLRLDAHRAFQTANHFHSHRVDLEERASSSTRPHPNRQVVADRFIPDNEEKGKDKDKDKDKDTGFDDVLATRTVCKRIASRSPAVWRLMVTHADGAALAEFADASPAFHHTQFHAGRAVSNIFTSLGPNPEVRDEILVLDLSADAARDLPIFESDKDVVACLNTHTNLVQSLPLASQPLLTPIDFDVKSARAENCSGDALDWARKIQSPYFAGLRSQLVRGYLARACSRLPRPSPHYEGQLHDETISARDSTTCRSFHVATWEARPKILQQLVDPRLREFGRRIVAAAPHDLLDDTELGAHLEWLSQRLNPQEQVPWRTLPDAMKELEALLALGLPGEHVSLLLEHLASLESRLSWLP